METSTNKQGTVVEQPVEVIAGSPPVCSLVNAERRERRFADGHAHDDTEHLAIVDTDITDDVHKATAPPTRDVTALAADGDTESRGTGVPGVASAPRSRRAEVAADAEGVPS